MSKKPLRNGLMADRVIERGRGCWNCIHYDGDVAAQSRWSQARQADLAKIVENALRLGEDHEQVKEQRNMIDQIDRAVAARQLGVCLTGKSESTLVAPAYLCAHWSGRVGSSLATEGKPLDKLPDELMDRAEPPTKS